MPIKVMIVDDSAVVRQVLSGALDEDAGIEVIGTAQDPIFAMDKMQRQWPDVIVLDVEMPRMDGITFLKKIMATRPTAVVICSTLTAKGSETALQAISAGAFAIVTKPTSALRQFLTDSTDELIHAIKAAAKANPRRLCSVKSSSAQPPVVTPKLTADAVLAAGTASQAMLQTTETVVAIGTSTGGTQALELVLKSLPRVCPGIVVVQHMPEKFTASFAQRLDSLCQIQVKEAAHGDRVMPGRALIAPGGKHMMLRRNGAQYVVDVVAGPPVSRHCPSVDVLFRSAARFAGKNAIGVIMTGMGDDGAKGLREMYDAGAWTVAQDEESCVVFGMPKEAIKLGAVNKILSLGDIPDAIQGRISRRG